MSICANCKTSLSCDCQKRIATNGMQCCAKCVSDYEQKIRQEKLQQEQQKRQHPWQISYNINEK